MDDNDVGVEKSEETSRRVDATGGAGRNNVVVKVGMVGDAQVGKTSLMVKYVEGKFDEDYIHTLGADFIRIRHEWISGIMRLSLTGSYPS